MTRPRRLSLLLAAALLAQPMAGVQPAGREEDRAAMVAVVPPTTVIKGRVLMKDGVTPVRGARVVMTGRVDGEARSARTDGRGRFKVRMPAGEYRLEISERMEVYRGSDVYRVPALGRMEIDFLLLPDYEPAPPSRRAEPADGRLPTRRGPDPRAETPVVVGTVVDILHAPGERVRSRRWAELLGFLGSILAVAIATD